VLDVVCRAEELLVVDVRLAPGGNGMVVLLDLVLVVARGIVLDVVNVVDVVDVAVVVVAFLGAAVVGGGVR
jgi:hypothetical protein